MSGVAGFTVREERPRLESMSLTARSAEGRAEEHD
jgi:hypothetical protein